jgi:hypothetical protein
MNVTSLDKIVKNILVKRRYPLQYYIEFLVNAKDCLRELGFDGEIDTLRYVVLPVGEGNEVQIPNDYTDYCRLSVWVDQYLHPLVEENNLQLVPNFDSNFEIQPYNSGIATSTANSQIATYNGYLSPYWWMNNTNAYGENLGRQFGGVGGQSDTFRINKARNCFKINENMTCTNVVLEYAGNGMSADAATHIDTQAQSTIEAYCMWMFKENNRTYNMGETSSSEERYINERMKLRARKSDLTLDKLKRIVQSNAIGVKY